MGLNQKIEILIKNYGDLLFDLCESLLWSSANAQLVFRSILKDLQKKAKQEPYLQFERAWILKIACDQLRAFSQRYHRLLTPSEQIEIDSTQSVTHRLKQFNHYFHRLKVEDRIILLLHDKYKIPYSDIACAIQTPEDSLKTQRQQALHTLEEWLWNSL